MTINYVLVSSPDKISLTSFIRYLRKVLGKDYETGEMHNLMTKESVKLFINDFIRQYSKGIFSYYARRAVNIEPYKVVPIELIDKVDIFIWFDLYSTEPKILKDPDNNMQIIIKDWNEFIESINK